jgi:hypothetical protein
MPPMTIPGPIVHAARLLSSPAGQIMAILAAATVLALPCLINGVPPIGDSVTHTLYQYHFSQQFWSGDYYPRWLLGSNKGLGSPIFLIQYPLPYWLTALLRPVLRFPATATREAHELGVLCFIVMATAALAARVWFRRFSSPLAATAAAIIYISLPYFFGQDLYSSVAIGQLFGFIWMPIALAMCHCPRTTVTSVSGLGLALGLLILSNPISALIFFPLLILYSIACGEPNRINVAKRTAFALLSLAMGTGLAAIYVFPLIAYHHLFNFSAMPRLLPGFTLSNNFLFVTASGLSKLLFAELVAVVALVGVVIALAWRKGHGLRGRTWPLLALGLGVAMVIPGLGPRIISLSNLGLSQFDAASYPGQKLITALSTLALGVLAYYHVWRGDVDRRDSRPRVLLAAGCCAFLLMLPWSAWLWQAVPKLSTMIQFPHRLDAILTLATAGLLASAIDRSLKCRENSERVRSLAIIASLVLFTIALGVFTWRVDRTWTKGMHKRTIYEVDATRDVDVMYRTYVPYDDLAAFATLLGTDPSSFQNRSTPVMEPTVTLLQARGVATVTSRSSRTIVISSVLDRSGLAQIGMLYSPLWEPVPKADLVGTSKPESSAAGLMEAPLNRGRHDLELIFKVGWPERCGESISVASALVALGGLAFGLYARIRQWFPDGETKCA